MLSPRLALGCVTGADATRNYAQLEKPGEGSQLLADFLPRAEEISGLIESENVLTASATIYNSCD
jgi:hypothetical protein